MRSGLAVLLLVLLVGCPASHRRKGRSVVGEDATAGSAEGDADVEPTDPDEPDEVDAGADPGDAEGDADSDTDAAASDASMFGVEILSPRAGAQFYTFEQVALRGACRGEAGQTWSASFRTSTQGATWRSDGSDVSRRFDAPGVYQVELTCRSEQGEERRASLDLTIHPTPSIVYPGRAAGATSDAVFATRLDGPGHAIQLSPPSEAFAAKFVDAVYNAQADQLLVRGNLFDRDEEVLGLMRPCRSAACAGEELGYRELVPEAHTCELGRFGWSPDGRSAFVSYACDGAPGATSYWVDLSGDNPTAHALGTSPGAGTQDGFGEFTPGGDVLIFQAGTELKALDTRAGDHPVVSLGDVGNGRWLLSPARDRLLVLGDKGYTLSTSALMARAASALTEIDYTLGTPRLLNTGATHVLYALTHVDADGWVTYETRLIRWDGSRDLQLCTRCLPLRCGDRIMLRDTETGTSSVVRVALDSTSDIVQTIPLPPGAPAANFLDRFDDSCSLAIYHSHTEPYDPVVWDIDHGEWLQVPGVKLAPDGRHLANATSIIPLKRAPLRTEPAVVSWSSGNGGFSPDGSHYLLNGKLAGDEGLLFVDLQTYAVERLADQTWLTRYDADGSHLLVNVGKFDQRLVERALPSRQVLWQSERGKADWATVENSIRPLPGGRAIGYRAMFTADGIDHLYTSRLDPLETLRFGAFYYPADDWAISPDGSLLGMGTLDELTLWSFSAQGAAAPLVTKRQDVQTDCQSFEVGADGMLCVGRGRMAWLDAKSRTSTEVAPLPATGTYWKGTRGPDGGTRGVLLGLVDYQASASWLDFSQPGAVGVQPDATPRAMWMLSSDRRYLLREARPATTVTDLASGETRPLTAANDHVTLPGVDEYYANLQAPGRIVFTDDYRLYWVDLANAVVTASPQVGRVLSLYSLGTDRTRVLVLNEDKTRLLAMGQNGERTTLYQDDAKPLYDVITSDDGRSVALFTDDATMVLPSDGSAPAKALAPVRIDNARFDRTGRFLAGRVREQSRPDERWVWKVWNLDAPETAAVVTPEGFRTSFEYTPLWVQ